MLIEESDEDLLELFDEVSIAASNEKGDKPPLSKMLFYPTRKPLIVSRAIILASLLNKDKKGVMRELLYLNRSKRPFTFQPNKEKLSAALNKQLSKISLLDPFAGAGSIVFEACRLGVTCTAYDYNQLHSQ